MKKEEKVISAKPQERGVEQSKVSPKIQEKKEAPTSLEKIKRDYKYVLDSREVRYDKDVKNDPRVENMRTNLEIHNKIVLGYASELINEMGLSDEERVAAIIATIEHDAGKLSSGLLDHHERGAEYAEAALDDLMGKEFEGIEITPEIKQKVTEAIERHMNHPFLVMLNKGERFLEPQDNVDKVVFDADMMANAGFKNVAFRIVSEDFMKEDAEKAEKNGTIALQESFNNVMQGVRALPDVVISDVAKKTTNQIVGFVDQIMESFIKDGAFEEIQNLFSDEQGNFNIETINQGGGITMIKKIINEKILIVGEELGIDTKYLHNFQI